MKICNVCKQNLETETGDETFKIRLLLCPIKNGKGIITTTLDGDFCAECGAKKILEIKGN